MAVDDPQSTVHARDLTRDAFAARVAAFPVGILPLGATEQHGYHMPLGTDTILAEALATGVAERTGATVLPSLPFGYSYVWRDAPGTVTLSNATMEAVLRETAEGLARQGVRHLVLVSGHEANGSVMKAAARALWDHPGIDVHRVFYPGLRGTMAEHCASPTWHGIVHACEFETSLMLAVAPDLVAMERAVAEYPERDPAYFMGGRPMGELSESGVFGDATLGTAEKGDAMLAVFIDRIAGFVRGLPTG